MELTSSDMHEVVFDTLNQIKDAIENLNILYKITMT